MIDSQEPRRPSRFLEWLKTASLLLAVSAATSGRGTWAAPNDGFRAGAHAVDITPEKFPISMTGQMHDQIARSAHDRLHARCLVLDDAITRVAIVVIDSCMVPREILDEAKERASASTGIPVHRMLMSATHTHTAPAVSGTFQTEPDAGYVRFLIAKVAEGVEKAAKNLEPARIGWGVGSDPTQVFCRDWIMKPGKALTNPFSGTHDDQVQMHPGYQNPNAVKPTSPVDPDVSLLSVQAKDGRPIALLANYSMHYAGYGIPAGTVSADYFGRFAQRIAALIGAGSSQPPFVGMMSNGTSGNLHCYDYSKPRQDVTIDSVAESVAKAAFAAYQKIEYHDRAPIVMKESLLRLKIRMPNQDEIVRAKEVLSKAAGRPLQGLGEIYARETVLMGAGPPDVEIKLQALRVGELGIAAIPNEVLSETGLAIKRQSPLKPTFTIELANGAHGYIPPPERHKLGGYETWRARSSCLEIEAEPRIRAQILQLLKDVSGDGARDGQPRD